MIKQNNKFAKHKIITSLLSLLFILVICLYFLIGRSISVGQISERLIGNWAGIQANGANITYTFCENGIVSVIKDKDGFLMKSLTGKYSINGDTVIFEFENNGTTKIDETETIINSFSLSSSGQNLTLSIPEDSITLDKTNGVSMIQLAGVWNGRDTTGAHITYSFDLDGMISTTTEYNDEPIHSYSGFYTLSDGYIYVIFTKDGSQDTLISEYLYQNSSIEMSGNGMKIALITDYEGYQISLELDKKQP